MCVYILGLCEISAASFGGVHLFHFGGVLVQFSTRNTESESKRKAPRQLRN